MNSFFAVPTRLELATSGVTGRYSNQLNYSTVLLWAFTDSNRRPSACKADALNQLS